MTKKIAVFGASGFVGQHLVAEARARGFYITTIGRQSDDDIVIDLTSFDEICRLPLKEYHAIVDVAAVNETLISRDIKTAYDVNVTRARAIVELSKRNDIGRISYCSTFHVYGKQYGAVAPTDDCRPKNDYGLTHLLAELIYRSWGNINGTIVNIVRPTNIYGIPASMTRFNRWTLVPYDFVRAALVEKKIEIRSNGLQFRNFVSIENVVNCLLTFEDRTVNAIGVHTISIRDFASLVKETLKEKFGEIQVTWQDDGQVSSPALHFPPSNFQVTERESTLLVSFIKDFACLYANTLEDDKNG